MLSLYIFFTAVDCGPLAAPVNGTVVISNTTFGSTATYTCIDGYFLTGETTRTCGSDGIWSDSDLTCEREFCTVL